MIFKYQNKYGKKEKRLAKHRRKVITGNARTDQNHFREAPEPGRDLFIYRILKDSSVKGLKDLVERQNVEVRSIECISNPNALYKSFKLTVPKSQLETIFNETFPWPSGVRVRKSFNMRRTAEHNLAEQWDSDSNRNN